MPLLHNHFLRLQMAILAGCGSKLPGNLAKNYNFVLMICSIRLFFFGFKANKPQTTPNGSMAQSLLNKIYHE